MENQTDNSSSRESILRSIRTNLAASKLPDARESAIKHVGELLSADLPSRNIENDSASLVELFKSSLEAVDGHGIVVHNESDVVRALTDIITRLQRTDLQARRIAISDSPKVERLVRNISVNVDEVAITPSASNVFTFDIGISGAQAGIAETGTLLLDSSRERHRLVSLVPPVHIAILDASQIVATLGEALSTLRQEEQVSPIVTLVTGPSRTADIELTLAIGVHGPQELYVIVNDSA